MQPENKPLICYRNTYCLPGVYTPIVDPDNTQAAQACIAGSTCEAGSDSPSGKGKCPEGFYCPPGTIEAIPCPPGYFCAGTGNVVPAPCEPGKFQDLP